MQNITKKTSYRGKAEFCSSSIKQCRSPISMLLEALEAANKASEKLMDEDCGRGEISDANMAI